MNDLLAAAKRDFIAECLRIAAIKASHGAENILIGDDLNTERDIRLAIANLREAARASARSGGRASHDWPLGRRRRLRLGRAIP
jgi:hypothetical protein